MSVKEVLRQLIVNQVEQNELALKIAYEETSIQYLSIRSGRFVPDLLKEGHEKSLKAYKAAFHKNQEKLRKLSLIVAAAATLT